MYKSISYVRVRQTFIKLVKANVNLFELPNNKDLKYGARPWFTTYYILIILDELAILAPGNIAAKACFNWLYAGTEKPFTTDFSVQIISAFQVCFTTYTSSDCDYCDWLYLLCYTYLIFFTYWWNKLIF